MFGQRLPGPFGTAGQPVVIGIAGDEVDRQLAPNDQLLEQRIHILTRCLALARFECDCQRADVTEMKMG